LFAFLSLQEAAPESIMGDAGTSKGKKNILLVKARTKSKKTN
jgi:hypothetical protein